MKILFYVTNRSMGMGSYRIWINDLNSYFRRCDIQSSITSDYGVINNHDVIICSKGDADAAARIKKEFPNKKVGVINLSADRKLKIDFVIVGSIEEMESLSTYDNVFLYPLIEKMYQRKQDYKTHVQKDTLRIGFHGHYPHLNKFQYGLKQALEKFKKVQKIELLIITGNPDYVYHWPSKPNEVPLISKGWDFNTVKQHLLSCDIGVVPNTTCLHTSSSTSIEQGLYNTDYTLRLKNKSNAGRSFVFHQLGIPVIADLTPSNFHILGNPDNGFIANSKSSWLKALIKLKSHETRQRVADSAKKEFDRLYNPKEWAVKLYKNILEMTNE